MYVETDCTVSHNGASFEASGATIAPDYAIGYLADSPLYAEHPNWYGTPKHVLTTWHGEWLGNASIVASWRTPRSAYSDRMYQVEVIIDGRTYTGRSNGVGMVWKGKPKATRRHS